MTGIGDITTTTQTEVNVTKDGESAETYTLSVQIMETVVLGKDSLWGTGQVIETTATDAIVRRRHLNNPKTVYLGKI